MNLYLVSQGVNSDYDTYDSFVVAAESENDARAIHPSGRAWNGKNDDGDWCAKEDVAVTLVGKAAKLVKGVVCASFNAG